MERKFRVRLLLAFGGCVSAERSALRIDARPSASQAFEDMRENAFFIHRATVRRFVVE
jgi:hypothetical protein